MTAAVTAACPFVPLRPYKRIRTELVEIQTATAAFVNQVFVIGLIADTHRRDDE